jgi:hypothetical protein
MTFEDWREVHGNATALMALAASVLSSATVAYYMNVSELNTGKVFASNVLGAQLYLSPVGIGVLLTGLISGEVYLVFKIERTRGAAESLVLFSFSLLSATLALVFAKAFADAYFPDTGTVLVTIVSFGIFISIFLTFLVLIGEYSEATKNLLLLVFGATIGEFFSLIIPSVALVGILAIVVLVDVVLTFERAKAKSLAEPVKLSFTTRDWGVGLGDVVVFCMVADKSLIFGGAPSYLLSVAFLFVGLGIGMRLAMKERNLMLPGTLIGAVPASLPILVGLLARPGAIL